MARDESLWARCRVNWHNDERVCQLTPGEFKVNHVLWCTAVKLRREILPPEVDSHYLASQARVALRIARSALQKMASFSDPLIVLEGACIRVVGVAEVHRGLWAWKGRRDTSSANEHTVNTGCSSGEHAGNTAYSSGIHPMKRPSRASLLPKSSAQGEGELESESSQPGVSSKSFEPPVSPSKRPRKRQARAPVPLETAKTAPGSDPEGMHGEEDGAEPPKPASDGTDGKNGKARALTDLFASLPIARDRVGRTAFIRPLGRVLCAKGMATWEEERRFRALLIQGVAKWSKGQVESLRGWLISSLLEPKYPPADWAMAKAGAEMQAEFGHAAKRTLARVLADIGKKAETAEVAENVKETDS